MEEVRKHFKLHLLTSVCGSRHVWVHMWGSEDNPCESVVSGIRIILKLWEHEGAFGSKGHLDY